MLFDFASRQSLLDYGNNHVAKRCVAAVFSIELTARHCGGTTVALRRHCGGTAVALRWHCAVVSGTAVALRGSERHCGGTAAALRGSERHCGGTAAALRNTTPLRVARLLRQ
ncbi:hypothetical protein LBMAG49_23130 [Planctomycetota bacterium]|nr:hypothetical protein LBMAG49_23130 [Planctomycetota bacterium]